MKNSNDTIGNRIRDLLACSAVPQPCAPQVAPYTNIGRCKNRFVTLIKFEIKLACSLRVVFCTGVCMIPITKQNGRVREGLYPISIQNLKKNSFSILYESKMPVSLKNVLRSNFLIYFSSIQLNFIETSKGKKWAERNYYSKLKKTGLLNKIYTCQQQIWCNKKVHRSHQLHYPHVLAWHIISVYGIFLTTIVSTFYWVIFIFLSKQY